MGIMHMHDTRICLSCRETLLIISVIFSIFTLLVIRFLDASFSMLEMAFV